MYIWNVNGIGHNPHDNDMVKFNEYLVNKYKTHN